MTQTILILCLLASPLQKIKVQYSKGVLHYGNEVLKVEVLGSIQKSYRFTDIDGNELIYFKRRREATREIDQDTGKDVMVTFFDVMVKGCECHGEIGEKELGLAMMSEKKTIIKLAEFTLPGLLNDAGIKLDVAQFLCKKLGNHYSDLLYKP